ncbi:T6SS immunity protein Tli4 family protein [Paraburkholderia heleia]|uniref:T6SS immunity protein Tli4 family protein n=1 Tax=Paraburkholderia heleia TaxID=634127 RepID=UPI002AB78FA2|nr:T6SS immunity protein Tli4 family protein [Paraburkholderia heleia]
MNIRPIAALLFLPLLIMAACGRQSAVLTEKEKHNVSQLTENLKTRCVGRYLIDMPADALVSGGAKVQGVTIESEAMSHEAYLREVMNRKAELRGTKSIDPYPFLYADDEVNGPETHYLIYRGNVSDGAGRRVFEAYKWDHGYRFKFGIEGYDYLHPDQTNDPAIQQFKVKNDVPEKTRLVFNLVNRLRWRADDDIPAEPGLCVLGAFLSGKPADNENAWAQFVLDGNRDVSIGFESDSSIREPNTLLQCGDQINSGLQLVDGRTIRKGAVALSGIGAEEWLLAGKTVFGVSGNTFTLEANSMTSSAQSPLLILDLETGSPNAFMRDRIKGPSVSENEAVALWDVISRTLRTRPNGF